jgi:hypothetical protein
MTWEEWNGNMAVYYSQEPIVFSSEEEWKLAAQHMSSLVQFETYPVPSPDNYDNWQDWASEFTLTINGPSR